MTAAPLPPLTGSRTDNRNGSAADTIFVAGEITPARWSHTQKFKHVRGNEQSLQRFRFLWSGEREAPQRRGSAYGTERSGLNP
jgi:hypothetical protein